MTSYLSSTVDTHGLRSIHINHWIVSGMLRFAMSVCICGMFAVFEIEKPFFSLFHNFVVQSLYWCSSEKLLYSEVLVLIDVFGSLFFFSFFPTQHLSAVIFSVCSQRLEELCDLRCGSFLFIYSLGVWKEREREASITVIVATYFKIGIYWVFLWKVHWILVCVLRMKGRYYSQLFRVFE